jgi:NADH-quinone oxidoreductase subunit K
MNFIFFTSLSTFIIGLTGLFVLRRHLIIILFSFELIILSIIILFASSSILIDDLMGQIYSLLILTIAASESALGLALIIAFYRLRESISVDLINLSKS